MKDDEVGEESLNSDSEEEYNINKFNDKTKILENIKMEIYDTISPNLLPMRTKHTNHTNNNFQPLELFYNFFDDTLISKICENSNKYM